MNTDSWTAVAAVATGISAIATGIAAGVTAWMARETKKVAQETAREADQSKRQLEISSLALQADTRPWLRPVGRIEVIDPDGLTDAEKAYSPDGRAGEIWIIMSVENVGRGLAVFPQHACELRPHGRPEGQVLVPVSALKVPVLQQGESAEVFFKIRKATASGDFRSLRTVTGQDKSINGELLVDIVSSDTAGGQATRVQVQLAVDEGGHWTYGRIDYVDEVSGDAIASTHVRPD